MMRFIIEDQDAKQQPIKLSLKSGPGGSVNLFARMVGPPNYEIVILRVTTSGAIRLFNGPATLRAMGFEVVEDRIKVL